MDIHIMQAVLSLVPNAKCSIVEDKIVHWNSEEAQPTEEEITAEQERLQDEYDANEYKRNRAAEYPSIEDQLDDIYHNGIDAWKATIKTTKDKYPKQSE